MVKKALALSQWEKGGYYFYQELIVERIRYHCNTFIGIYYILILLIHFSLWFFLSIIPFHVLKSLLFSTPFSSLNSTYDGMTESMTQFT